MSIDKTTLIGKEYHRRKYIPMDKLLNYYNGLMAQRSDITKPNEIEQLDRELNAVKEIFKETAHE